MKSFLDKWQAFAKSSILAEQENSQTIDLSGFKINETLEPRVWTQNKRLEVLVRRKLIDIANQFWESLDLPTVKIEDITFTGSLANYNWSRYSDVDLHILVDFNLLPGDEEITKAMMNARRAMWNNKHDIEVFGYEVEIYVQDSNEVHHSTGVYSVLRDHWLVEPQRKLFTIDEQNVKLKARHVMKQIDKIEVQAEAGNYHEVITDVDRLKEKIRKFRKCGLESGGEYSPENLAFKVLRRNLYLEKLSKLKTQAYDRIMSMSQ